IAAALFAPTVIWQDVHGWPTLEFMQNASRDKMQLTTPFAFVLDQILNMNPLLLPVWLGGLLFLLIGPGAARGRALAIAFVAVAAILIVNRTSRSSYLAPAYPVLFAAGGVGLERLIVRRPLRIATMALVLAAGTVSAPLGIPLLPVERYVRYSRALGQTPSTEEKKDVGRLPQFFADRQGWERMVDQIGMAL